jgi:signal transduction histidine kinase
MKYEKQSGTSTLAKSHAILGTGEMADLTRRYDWKKTSLGPIEQWPECLLTTVNILLQSRHPMFLWWGKDLIQFYNDAYRPSIREDKHPKALGQRGRECWPEIWHIIGPQIDAVIERGEASWHENQLVPIQRNGVIEDVYWTYGYSPVCNLEGENAGVLVVCTETTASVLARDRSKREMSRLAALFQQAPVFFAVLDGPNFVYEMVNDQYLELVGHRNFLGRAVKEAVPEAAEQGFIKLLENVFQTGETYVGRNTPIQLARRGPDTLEQRYIDFVYQARREADGSISGIIVLGVDVTESKRAAQVLLQSEKLNAAGRLASSIAHEINNPLEAITNLLYLAQSSAVGPEAQKYLQDAEVELRRVSAIANQTLRFYRQTTRPEPMTAKRLIDETLPLYQGKILNWRIRVERRERAKHEVTCLDGEIRQVLSNLIANAIDAMHPVGGRLLIRSREATHWKTGRRSVVLTVADTGSGMSVNTKARIFEPFFTTKDGRGTGLGLWISREIVDRHKGIMRVRSSQMPGASGTVFTILLPYDD